jgi:LysW-gamma-L-lysine/LysW-L-ornithine aminotransferase
MMNTIDIEEKFELPLAPKRGINIVRGRGANLWDDNGKEYLDCGASYGVCNAGHCNPEIVQAMCQQSDELIYVSDVFTNTIRAQLLEKISEITGMQKVYLCNSGTESVEAAMKFARISTGRKNFIATMRSFHGRTMGSLSLTHKKKYREPFLPLVPGVTHVPYNNIERMREVVNDETAAVVLEPIQGEGGVRIPSDDYLREVRKICDEKGALLILDEVQMGMCRTGSFFAFEQSGIVPDIICIAKSLGNGFPIGATACNEKIKVTPLSHGTTFGGNPLACSAALATINYMQKNNLAKETKEKGEYLLDLLKNIKSDKIREIRGRGLIVGIELNTRVGPFLKELMERGVLALPAGSTVIRLLPPLTISRGELSRVVNTLGDVLG